MVEDSVRKTNPLVSDDFNKFILASRTKTSQKKMSHVTVEFMTSQMMQMVRMGNLALKMNNIQMHDMRNRELRSKYRVNRSLSMKDLEDMHKYLKRYI